MNNARMLLLIPIMAALCTQRVYSQQKYERESRLAPENVPPAALEFIDALEITSKIKWYSEIGLESKSIEAKFKRDGQRHSIEFDTIGAVEDVEIEMKLQELKPFVKGTITSQLSSTCSRYKISKIQIQFTGREPELLSFLKGAATSEALTKKYEIVAKCVTRKAGLFEYLFSDQGTLLETSEIIFKNSSNLEY